MPDVLYVGLQDDDTIAVFAIDADGGQLSPRGDIPAAGGPSVMALSPDRRTLYVGQRSAPAISSFRIDPGSGGLTLIGTRAAAHAPTFAYEPHIAALTTTCSSLPRRIRGQISSCNCASMRRPDASPPTRRRGSNRRSASARGITAFTQAVPSAFGLVRSGRFLYAVGTASGRLAAYRIDGATGALSALATYAVGRRPAAVLTVRLS